MLASHRVAELMSVPLKHRFIDEVAFAEVLLAR